MSIAIELTVNGKPVRATVDDRLLLADFLRDELNLTGTHLGCEHGVCGACTVLVDGRAARSCLMLAAQADGCQVTTIEALAHPRGPLHPIQQAFRDCHGLQCGFCTPGMILATLDLLQTNPDPSEREIREALSGNICRCTGYVGIVAAVRQAARALRSAAPPEGAT
ncbi:MAG TPA: (2Fe-2S)-binding protein [Dehalococcoidia bacterium]|nr:(2Fe-2S)-binding protein [Dehalococcoidia bacterium]